MLLGLCCQPVDGLVGGGGVVAHVLGFADAWVGGGVEVVALARDVGSKRAVEVANALLDVHGMRWSGKPVSSSGRRKCSLPMVVTAWPCSVSRWPQLGRWPV